MTETLLSPGVEPLGRVRFANFVLDPQRAEVLRDGVAIPLRPKVFQLLVEFARRPGRVISKEDLVAAVWPGVVVTEDSLTQCMHELRAALGERDARLLRTVPRRGYILDAAVEADLSRHPLRRGHAVAAGALVAVLAGSIVLFQLRNNPPPAATGPLSIVVLPFSSQGTVAETPWLVEALQADLTLELARTSGTVVISRDTASRYGGGNVPPREIARELGVRYVVQGTLREDDGRLSLALSMVEGDTGVQHWSSRLDLDRGRLKESLEEIAGRIARSLSVQMLMSAGERAVRLPPQSRNADDLAMQGWSVYFRGVTRENLIEAAELFERSVAMDAGTIRGWGGVAVANGLLVGNLWAPDRAEAMTRLEGAAQRLRTLDENDINHLWARYFIALLNSDYEALLLVSTGITERFPSNPQGHFGRALSSMNLGRFNQCVEPTLKALRLGPRDPAASLWNRQIGTCYFMRGDYAEAARYSRIAQQGDLGRALPTLQLAASLARLGNRAEAERIVADFRARNPAYRADDVARVLRPNRNERYLEGRGRWISTLRELGLP